MAITEVFGGMGPDVCTYIHAYTHVLIEYRLCIWKCRCVISWYCCDCAEFRTGKTQLSHTLCGKIIHYM